MRRNKLALFLHLVWGTWDRLPMPNDDPLLIEALASAAGKAL